MLHSRYRESPTVETHYHAFKVGSSGQVLTEVNDYHRSYGPVLKQMRDMAGPKDLHSRRVNPLLKETLSLYGEVPSSRPNWNWPGESFQITTPRKLYFTSTVDTSSLVPSLSESEISDFATSAREKFEDQMPQETSLPNFLIELRDIGGIIPNLMQGLKSGPVAHAKDTYLGYSFGTAPFIGDLYVLAGLVDSVRRRIEYLKQTWGKPTRLTHKFPDVLHLPAIRSPRTVDFIGPGFNSFRVYPVGLDVFIRFFGTLYHRLEGLDTVGGFIRGLLSATGFNSPLSVAWEAIPFSFVVDWVSNVGHMLYKLRAQPFQGVWDVSNVGYTVDSAWTASVEYLHDDYNSLWREVGTMSVRKVLRASGFPERFLNIDPRNMSPKQLSLFMALLLN